MVGVDYPVGIAPLYPLVGLPLLPVVLLPPLLLASRLGLAGQMVMVYIHPYL